MYREFAQVYDRLMADVPYAEWARYYAGLLELGHVRPGARCVECACGTGNLTIPLAKQGYSITGIDQSASMLNIAQAKAREKGERVLFIQQDMRKLVLPKKVDAVLATCDGINYLTAPDDVRSFFASAYHALAPDGILVFDVSTPYKLKEHLGSKPFIFSEDDLLYAWQGEYDDSYQLYHIHLDVFVKEAPDEERYLRIEEEQVQRAHTMSELKAWLNEAQFTNIQFFGNRTWTAPSENALRWHVFAQKKENKI